MWAGVERCGFAVKTFAAMRQLESSNADRNQHRIGIEHWGKTDHGTMRSHSDTVPALR